VRTRPHAALHYGGQLAAPVFREVATKLYAMYVSQKVPVMYASRKDSSSYFYAGNTTDIKNVYGTLKMKYADSATKGEWSSVYASNYQPVIKASAISTKVMPNVRGMGLKDALYLLEKIGVKVNVKGKGKVMVQSVAPGTALSKGLSVMLELS
jgi:cell division protein FtsI (penicillin-binding protein 3)